MTIFGEPSEDYSQRESISPLLPFPSKQSNEGRLNRVTVAFARDMDLIWDKEEKELVIALDEALSSSDPSAPIHLFSRDVFDVC